MPRPTPDVDARAARVLATARRERPWSNVNKHMKQEDNDIIAECKICGSKFGSPHGNLTSQDMREFGTSVVDSFMMILHHHFQSHEYEIGEKYDEKLATS